MNAACSMVPMAWYHWSTLQRQRHHHRPSIESRLFGTQAILFFQYCPKNIHLYTSETQSERSNLIACATELSVWFLDLANGLFTLASDHVCMFDKVTGILAVKSAFSSLYRINQRYEQVSFFFYFVKSFLPFPLPWWSNDLLVVNLAVNFEIYPWHV